MIIADPQISNPIFNNPVVKSIASYGGAIMGLFGIYFFSRKLFDSKPGLVIDENGIYDHTSAFNFGFIPWTDISQIGENSAGIAAKQRFVMIILINPDKYIQREKSFLKRKLLSANAGTYGSPVHISANGLKTSHDDLLQLLTDEFNKYKR
jgi:hypothetical protein